MHTDGFFVSLPGAPPQLLSSRLQVLLQELAHGDVGWDSNEVFLSRYGFRELLCAILAGGAIDATLLPPARCLYPVTCLPSSIRAFTRAAPVAIGVLSGHEQPPSCSWSGYRWGSRWWSKHLYRLFSACRFTCKRAVYREPGTPQYINGISYWVPDPVAGRRGGEAAVG